MILHVELDLEIAEKNNKDEFVYQLEDLLEMSSPECVLINKLILEDDEDGS